MLQTLPMRIERKTERAVKTVQGFWLPKSSVHVGPSGEFVTAIAEWLLRDKAGISRMIISNPTPVKVAPVPYVPFVAVPVGIYETPNGEIFKVKKGRSGSNYAMIMLAINSTRLTKSGDVIHAEFKYRNWANDIRKLKPEFKVSLARAEELSLRFNHCIACGHSLKVAKSVILGVGPVCRKKKDYWA